MGGTKKIMNTDKYYVNNDNPKKAPTPGTTQVGGVCGPLKLGPPSNLPRYVGEVDAWGAPVTSGGAVAPTPVSSHPFWSGVASVLDLGGVLDRPVAQHPTDVDAIRHDWSVVGQDLSQAIWKTMFGSLPEQPLAPAEHRRRILLNLARLRVYRRNLIKMQAEQQIPEYWKKVK